MKNLVLSNKKFSGYAKMTILPPAFSTRVELCAGEDCDYPEKLGFCISFGNGYVILEKISLFPIESDEEFIKTIATSKDADSICNYLLDTVMHDIARYIHKSKRTSYDGAITTDVMFPLDVYMNNWQEQLNSFTNTVRTVMNYKPSKE